MSLEDFEGLVTELAALRPNWLYVLGLPSSLLDESRRNAAQVIAPLVDWSLEATHEHLRRLDTFGPGAHYYMMRHMNKWTSAEDDRKTKVYRARFLMILRSMFGTLEHVRTRTLALDMFCCRNCCKMHEWTLVRGEFMPDFSVLAVDHIIPHIRGGTNAQENLQTLCRKCNSSKGAMTQQEWEDSGLAARRRSQ